MFDRAFRIGLAAIAISGGIQGWAAEPKPIPPEQFDQVHKMIGPQPGDNRFQEVPWLLSIHEARRQAAREGKPLFVWAGHRGAPLGDCRVSVASSRAPELWTEEFTSLIKNRCVGVVVADANSTAKRQDAVGDFVRRTKISQSALTSTHAMDLVSAGGEYLGRVATNTPGVALNGLKMALKKFDGLPEEKRAPGKVAIEQVGEDPKSGLRKPPDGCLIVRVCQRHLGRRENGALRYAVAADYLHDGKIVRPFRQWFAAPMNDFMWVPREEWQALVPKEPKRGAAVAVPEAFVLRLFRYHLNPRLAFTEGPSFPNADTNCGRLSLAVEDVSDGQVQFILKGQAKLQTLDKNKEIQVGYEPALLGRLTYDRGKKAFTRFDIVALGDMRGDIQHGGTGFRPGQQPLGIAFELTKDPRAAELLPPGGTRVPDYFQPRPRSR